MNIILETLNKAGLRFVEFASPMLIQSSILILILLAVDFLLRKKVRATFRYWIWMLVLIKLLLPVSLYSPLSLGSWLGEKIEYANLTQEDTGQRTHKSENIIDFKSEIRDFRPIEPRVETSESVTSVTHTIITNPLPASPEHVVTEKPVKLSWQAAAFLTWIAITAALGLVLLKRTVFIKELVTKASDIDFNYDKSVSPNDVLRHCCIYLDMKKQIPLKISPDATSPVVCGLLQPVILLPQNLISSLNPSQLKAIFFHEIAHIKRGDLWVNLLQTLLQIIYFYNPLLWLANSIIRRTREQAVDEMVLVAMGKDAREYPETLLNVAKLAFKRPALSLRLIGVVESEDALTGRIKHMLSRPLPKSAKLGLLGLLVIIVFAAILLPMAILTKPKMTVINNGPLDIKLIGISPDGGDELFDPNGKKIGKFPGFAVAYTDSWNPESQCRDFIFELPGLQDQLIFALFPKISVSENNRPLGGGFRGIYEPMRNPPTQTYSVSFSRSYYRNLLPFLNITKSIDYIDFSLKYYYGPRREATCTFTGPFIFDTTVKALENELYELTFKRSIPFYDSGLEMQFKTSQPFNSDTQVLIYDKQGKRYTTNQSTGNGGSSGTDRTYFNIPLSIDEIKAVTFGERPYEITFKNVKVQDKRIPPRTQPEYLDVMAQRLNLPKMTPDQLRQYRFKDPQETIEVIDIIRSQWLIRQAVETIQMSNPRVRIFEFDKETQEKIRKVAAQWASSSYVENFGLELGLMGKWPEFFDLAIERLNKNPPKHLSPEMEQRWRQENSSIANEMIRYKLDEFTLEQIQKLKQLALSTDDSNILTYVFRYFQNIKTQESTDALWELVQDDRPWIWMKAINIWYPRVANNRKVYEEVSEKIKLRLMLFLQNLTDEKLNEKADELLKQIFTPEFGKMASSEWNSLRTRISQKFDKKEVTEIYINYLRQLQNSMTTHLWIVDTSFRGSAKWEVVYIIRALNVWYGTNIGNLGTDETRDSGDVEPRNILEFQDLIAEVLRWYDENENTEPVELSFTGKVVDTSGNSVSDAKMIFTKMEDYVTELGYTNRRRVEVALITTDSSGQYSVVLDPKEQWYELNITADGFITREQLMVDCLQDGRFRFREYNSQQDNVFILQRPGRISGSLLGKDGKPLANTKLYFDISENYTSNDPAKNVITDSEGKFNVEGIPAEPLILSYTKLNQLGQGRDVHLEYGGLCGALVITNQEGQEQSGLILDLSKSVCSLELEVKDTNSEPLKQITLHFETGMPSGTSSKYRRIFHSKDENSDGVYKYDGLPSGKFHLRIYNSDSIQRELDIELSPDKVSNYQVNFGSLSTREQARLDAEKLAREKATANESENRRVYSAFLPNYGKLELVGIRKKSLPDQPWYSPDGLHILDSSDEIFSHLSSTSGIVNAAGTQTYEFFIHCDLPSNKIGKVVKNSWSFEPEKGIPGAFSTSFHIGQYYFTASSAFPETLNKINLTFDVSNGQWKTIAESDGKNEKEISVTHRGQKQNITLGEIIEKDGSVFIEVTHQIKEMAAQIIVFDKYDNIRYPLENVLDYANPNRNILVTKCKFDGITKDQIARYEFQVQPIDIVSFKDISLKNEFYTNPEIITTSITDKTPIKNIIATSIEENKFPKNLKVNSDKTRVNFPDTAAEIEEVARARGVDTSDSFKYLREYESIRNPLEIFAIDKTQFNKDLYNNSKERFEALIKIPNITTVYAQRWLIILDWLAEKIDTQIAAKKLIELSATLGDEYQENFTKAIAMIILGRDFEMVKAVELFRGCKPELTPQWGYFLFDLHRNFNNYVENLESEIDPLNGQIALTREQRIELEKYFRDALMDYADYLEYDLLPAAAGYVTSKNADLYRAIEKVNIVESLRQLFVGHTRCFSFGPITDQIVERLQSRILPDVLAVWQKSLELLKDKNEIEAHEKEITNRAKNLGISVTSLPERFEKVIEVTLDKVSDDNEVPWGQEIEKIQIRARVDQQWYEGQIPKFLVDVRNNGREDLSLVLAPEWWELELDGIWYKIGAWYSGVVPVMSLDSGEQKNGIEFVPTEHWEWNNNRDPLKFTEGTHEVRLLHTVFRKDPNDKRSTRVLSNRIEFEILPKEENSDTKVSESGVNIYLLADETLDFDTAKAMPVSELVLRDKPWISSQDIEIYDASSNCIYLKNERPEFPFKITSVKGSPFVVTANGQKCYMGVIIPAGSSYLPEQAIPTIHMTDYILLPSDIVRIQHSPFMSPLEERIVKELNGPFIVQALKDKGQYHEGLRIVLDKVDVSKTETGSSLSYTYTIINKDTDDLYVFDPDKMGVGLFHYFNNCPGLLPEGGEKSINTDHDKIVKAPDSFDTIDKSWFSLIKSGQIMTRTVTLGAYPEIPKGKYECNFMFHSPGPKFTKEKRAQFDQRVWIGQIFATLNINVNENESLSINQNSDISKRILKNEEIDLNLIYELLVGPQSGSRLLAAGYLGTHGDSNSIPYLIDALSDEASVVGIDFFVEENSDLRMNTVRYWANDSLKKLTGLDVGFAWNDPIEKRNKAIQKWKYWWEKNESIFQVINNNDREEIENIVESLWQAVDVNDTKKVSQLYYDKIIDNNDSNTNGLIHGLLKDKEQVEKQKGNDIASISNIVIKNNLAIAVTKPNIEALFIYYFVKPNDKWFLYYTQRRTNFSKIVDLEPSIAVNDLFNNWPRTKLDNEAFSAYLEAGNLLFEGAEREEVAKKYNSIGELYPFTDIGKISIDLGKLLDEMVQEDKKFVEPEDIERLSEKDKIDYYIYKLRDVAEQEMFIPGKCYVLRFPRTPNSAAIALRNMGPVVVPAMISLLEDNRPTRSVGLSLNGGVVLRYSDIALEIIADIAGQNKPNETTTFDPRTQRGAYLSNADEKIALEIINRAKSWWEQNKDKYD